MSLEPRHLFLSPHPDDIALSAYASLARIPPSVPRTLVTVFSQSCWKFVLPVDPSQALAVSACRLEEDLRFARTHGADLLPLGFRDTSLRLPRGANDQRVSHSDPLFPTIEAALRCVLENESPDCICYVPLGISGHVDHLIVRDAVLAIRGGPRRVVFYEDLPYCEQRTEEEIASYARALEPGQPLVPSLLELTRDWPGKLRGLHCYESQLEAQTIPRVERYARRLMGGRGLAERIWTVA